MERSETGKPLLRLIDARPFEYEGAGYLMLRDPLALSEKNLLVPQPFVPILALCDGTRTINAIRGALALRYGVFLAPERIEELVAALDDALLLENARSQQARAAVQIAFQQAEYRIPANAGATYPENPQELFEYLQSFLEAVPSSNGKMTDSTISMRNGHVRGVVSPHIDYERGGPVYAQVWSQAAEDVRSADLAIIFGTDHFSEGYAISLTRQNYATPYGVLPTAAGVVDQLAQVIGPEAAFAGELHHRQEHSIELAAVWMHHMRGGQPIETVPVLTGSLDSSLNGLDETTLETFLGVLRRVMTGRRAIIIAAGDLAHVGPAFDGEPVDPGKLVLLKNADDELIQAMCLGEAERFYQAIHSVQDQNNVCGVAPIYLTLRLLEPVSGQFQGYSVCPADTNQTSVVTICGVTLQ
jgi:MEMO1 family protein